MVINENIRCTLYIRFALRVDTVALLLEYLFLGMFVPPEVTHHITIPLTIVILAINTFDFTFFMIQALYPCLLNQQKTRRLVYTCTNGSESVKEWRSDFDENHRREIGSGGCKIFLELCFDHLVFVRHRPSLGIIRISRSTFEHFYNEFRICMVKNVEHHRWLGKNHQRTNW